jgi:hypothetical protein
MIMPGFTAEASFYRTNRQYKMRAAWNIADPESVELAAFLPYVDVDFGIDPNCGPCECHLVGSGLLRWRKCFRQCYLVIWNSVDPQDPNNGKRIPYTADCLRA